MAGVRRGRAVAAVLAGCLLAAGCSDTVVGHGDYLADPGTVTATPTGSPSPPTPTPTPSRPGPTATSASGTVPAIFGGTWRGPVSQPGSVIPAWNAQLVLPAGKPVGTFTVVSFCSGSVAVLSASPAQLVLREVITSDPRNKCAASGTMTLRRTAANRATMHWVDSDHPDNVADGNLTKA
ncbi:MAG: molecular chaperone DnaK [Mycobacteriales bacterium]|jgi:predicted small secreted protein